MSKLKKNRDDVEESPLVFLEPPASRRSSNTRNEAFKRLTDKLKQITLGKEVNNYLDADLEDCCRSPMVEEQVIMTPIPK